MNDTTTTDLAKFGARELNMVEALFVARRRSGFPYDFDLEGVTVMFNQMSGWVFFTNAEFQVVIEQDGELVSHYTSPYEGIEGTLTELIEQHNDEYESWNAEDVEWIRDIAANNRRDDELFIDSEDGEDD